MDDQGKDTEQKPLPEVIVTEQPGGVYRTYSNNLDISWNVHDLRLEFNDFSRVPPEYGTTNIPKNRIERRASITLAWTQAKALHTVLTEVLARFEKVNGEIKFVELP